MQYVVNPVMNAPTPPAPHNLSNVLIWLYK